jgi:predicted nuclease of predicted toxin-antitoxin system
MKVLLDMNIPLKYAELLNDKGIEAVRWSNIGAANASDAEVMAYANDNGFIVLTFDLDFSTILSATHERKPSIAQIRASIPHAEQSVDYVAAALLQNKEELAKGAILSIDSKKARITA